MRHWLKWLFVLVLLFSFFKESAFAQRGGSGQFAGPNLCSDVTGQITNQTYCYDWTTGALYVWNGTQYIQITGNNSTGGNITINGYQVFQGASTNVAANGAWTPVLKFNGASVGYDPWIVNAQWATAGKIATWEFVMALNNKGTSTGVATIAGLPSQMQATSATNAYGTCANLGGIAVGPVGYPYRVYPAMTHDQPGVIQMYADTGQNVAVQLTDQNFATTPNFQCTMTYIIQ